MRDRSPRAFPTMRAMTIGLAGLAFASLCVRAGASCRSADRHHTGPRNHHPRPVRSHLRRLTVGRLIATASPVTTRSSKRPA